MKYMILNKGENTYKSIGDIVLTPEGITFTTPETITKRLKNFRFLGINFTPDDGDMYMKMLVASRYQATTEHFELDESDTWTEQPINVAIVKGWVKDSFAAKGRGTN